MLPWNSKDDNHYKNTSWECLRHTVHDTKELKKLCNTLFVEIHLWSALRADQTAPSSLPRATMDLHFVILKTERFGLMEERTDRTALGTALSRLTHLPFTFLSNFFCFIFSLLLRRCSFASCKDSSFPHTSRARLITYRMDTDVFLFALK